jgi:hypothetical protein
MRDFNLYLKHTFSCLADQEFRVLIDEKMVVTIVAAVFDSALIGWLLAKIPSDDHKVVAFTDDNASWTPRRPPYSLRIRIGGDDGQEFGAEAVSLASAAWGDREVAITLAPANDVANKSPTRTPESFHSN